MKHFLNIKTPIGGFTKDSLGEILNDATRFKNDLLVKEIKSLVEQNVLVLEESSECTLYRSTDSDALWFGKSIKITLAPQIEKALKVVLELQK